MGFLITSGLHSLDATGKEFETLCMITPHEKVYSDLINLRSDV
jgi:hypothetical protein